MESYEQVEKLFDPRSVAVVGATVGRHNRGRGWLKALEAMGYKGALYAVSQREQVDHWPTYQRVNDIPGSLDLVIICVGPASVPPILADCVAKGVPWVVIYSAGFAESGRPEGIALRDQVLSTIKGTPTRLVGPNCMGPYCPSTGLAPTEGLSSRSGPVGLVCQSGVILNMLGKIGAEKGFGFSKAISYGGEADAPVHLFLEYLADDPDTKIIVSYVEGVKDGQAYLLALRRATDSKPVLVLKGGITEAGARAASSHTGALAGTGVVWQAVLEKGGAIQLESLEEMVDAILSYLFVQKPGGNRVAIVTCSGGASVLYTDLCVRSGFQVPELPVTVQEELRADLGVGTNVGNPVDIAQAYFNYPLVQKLLTLLDNEEGIDLVILHLPIDVFATTVAAAPWVEEKFLRNVAENRPRHKPMFVVLPYIVDDAKRAEVERFFLGERLAVFPTIDRGLRVVSKLARWDTRCRGA